MFISAAPPGCSPHQRTSCIRRPFLWEMRQEPEPGILNLPLSDVEPTGEFSLN